MSDTAVILLQMGGPDSLAAVRPFLSNLFSDREIIQIGPTWLQPLIAALIVRRRTPFIQEKYREIGGRSPIGELTRNQADSLSKMLGVPCLVGMRYWHPFTADTVKEIKRIGVRRLIALPLYPHFSRATSGSSLNDLKRAMQREDCKVRLLEINSFHNHPLYITALVEKITAAATDFSDPEGVELLFSAHSLPRSFIDQGDPYLKQVQETVRLVMQQLGGIRHHLAFQSRAGPVKWLEPSTDDKLKELAANRCKNLLVAPLSFVSDHIETLHEIDIEYAEMAHELGIAEFKRMESLNSSDTFIRCLAELVQQRLQSS